MLQDKLKEVIQTPYLWTGDLLGLSQFNHLHTDIPSYPENTHPNHLRLGKQIESFVDFQLLHTPGTEILAKNLQIIHNKQTLGEIDFLIRFNQTPIHLEVVYKFYLYNPSVGTAELDHWIGPNNKDCLLYKLEKFKTKQLPLLYKAETQPYLKHLNLTPEEIKQYVCFKAQLFVPFNSSKTIFTGINNACIKGFYITPEQLSQFDSYTFYIPNKHDWILPVTKDVSWMNYSMFTKQIEVCKQKKQAPLCWFLSPDGQLSKVFVYFEKENV